MIRIVFAASIAVLLAAPASAEDWDFVLVNNTGKPIKRVEIAVGGSNDWKADTSDRELQRKVVTEPGGRVTVHFNKGPQCRHDLKATFADETTAIWTRINVCDNAYVSVSFVNGVPVFKAN